MRLYFLSFLIFVSTFSLAQYKATVPSKMEFAGIKLRIMDDARKEIQKDVDALTASQKYFEIKAERARTYFPIIERIFKEEDLPDDFKYLCLQESALIADAVSSSNAVGFWQFKDFTAVEVGMRVDKYVDERKNIVASSRGAAKYMHKNNQYFDNWLHALQAYQMGAGGAMKVLKKGHEGAKSMVVNKKTYWYVKKYLAHKIAFQGATDKPGLVQVSEYYNANGKTIKEISKDTGFEEEEIADFNKWIRKGRVPEDKKYAVILPTANEQVLIASAKDPKEVKENVVDYSFDKPNEFPKIDDLIDARAGKIVEINDLPGIVAGRSDRIPDLSKKAAISLSKFLKYNDLDIDEKLVPGQVYYMKSKRGKAKAHYHIVQHGETLWSISQKFGIKLKKLKSKNRIVKDVDVRPGRVLWLRFIRPESVDIEYREIEKPIEEIDQVKVERNIEKEAKSNVIDTSQNVMSLDTMQLEETVTETIEINEEPERVDTEEQVVLVDNTISDFDDMENEPEGILKTHEVKLGETFYAISKLYQVAVLELLEWNELSISDKLSVGQKLSVYVTEPVEVEKELVKTNKYHEVTEGDTLYSISKKYGIAIQDILKWNDKSDTSISLGDKLIIDSNK